MASSSTLIYLAFLLSLLAICIIRLRKSETDRQLPLPPGPQADPIIGHARFIPPQYSWKTFSDWGKKWGRLTNALLLNSSLIEYTRRFDLCTCSGPSHDHNQRTEGCERANG